jgi:hypothetical protein
VNRVPRWRLAAAGVVVAVLAFLLAVFAPYYFRNLRLQNFVSAVTQRADARTVSDDVLRTWVLERAHELQLPITADNVRIKRTADGPRIDVRYFVRVDLPGYTVDLHFYPGAGSR